MSSVGKQYHVRGSQGIEKTMEIQAEQDELLMVKVVTRSPYGVMESEETLSRQLFESCLRTGFIQEIPMGLGLHSLTVA